MEQTTRGFLSTPNEIQLSSENNQSTEKYEETDLRAIMERIRCRPAGNNAELKKLT